MELGFKDPQAEAACSGKKERVVALVHAQIGLASAAIVSTVSPTTLKIEAVSSSFLVTTDLSRVI